MSLTTLLAAIAAALFHESMRFLSVPTSASGRRMPVLALAWQLAQLASNSCLPLADFCASIANGYLGGGSLVRYSCSHLTCSTKSSLCAGGAPSRPSAESMMTE